MGDTTSMVHKKSDTEAYSLWNRVGCVEIFIPDQYVLGRGRTLSFPDVDFKFKVTKTIGDFPEGFVEVSILGLTQDTMNEIVTICNMTEALAQGKKIRVYAGYDGQDKAGSGDKSKSIKVGSLSTGEPIMRYVGEKIIEADISYAKVDTAPPEMWLSIVGVVGYRNKFQQINVSFPGSLRKKVKSNVSNLPPFLSGIFSWIKDGELQYEDGNMYMYTYEEDNKIKYSELCQKCVDIMNVLYKAGEESGSCTVPRVVLDFYAQDRDIEFFVSSGSISDMIASLQQLGDYYVYLDNDREKNNIEHLVVIDRPKDSQPEDNRERVNRMKSRVRTKYLSLDTGLIGIPSVSNATSLSCRMLLDAKLTAGDYINLKSERMPAANGDKWQITKITHTGHKRGIEWYTDVVAVDYDRLCANQKEQKRMQKKVIELEKGIVDVEITVPE